MFSNIFIEFHKLCVVLVACFLIMLVSWGECLLCYECKNVEHKGCGEDFQMHDDDLMVTNCSYLKDVKCAIQRQPPLPNGWVGIQRICYEEGNIPGLNSSNGCRDWTNPQHNYTASYCFCDTDYCNNSNDIAQNKCLIFLCSLLLPFVYKNHQ